MKFSFCFVCSRGLDRSRFKIDLRNFKEKSQSLIPAMEAWKERPRENPGDDKKDIC